MWMSNVDVREFYFNVQMAPSNLKLCVALEFPLVVSGAPPPRYIDLVFSKPEDVPDEVFKEILSEDVAVEVPRVFSECRRSSIVEEWESIVFVHLKFLYDCGFQI